MTVVGKYIHYTEGQPSDRKKTSHRTAVKENKIPFLRKKEKKRKESGRPMPHKQTGSTSPASLDTLLPPWWLVKENNTKKVVRYPEAQR